MCSETNIRDSMPSEEIAKIFRNKIKLKLLKILKKALRFLYKKDKKSDILVILGSHFIAPQSTLFKNCFALDNKRLLT